MPSLDDGWNRLDDDDDMFLETNLKKLDIPEFCSLLFIQSISLALKCFKYFFYFLYIIPKYYLKKQWLIMEENFSRSDLNLMILCRYLIEFHA